MVAGCDDVAAPPAFDPFIVISMSTKSAMPRRLIHKLGLGGQDWVAALGILKSAK